MCRTLNFNSLRVTVSVALLLFLFSAKPSLNGQDLHYSQFYNAPLTISPGLTGIFNGDERVTVSFRDQGRSIPVPYTTFTVGYDRKFLPKKIYDHKGFFSGGAFFNYDRQGDSNLQLLNINLTGSYTLIVNNNNLLTFGAALGYANRGFDPDALIWDNQWDQATSTFLGGPSGEDWEFESFGFIETALGINYRWQKTERTKFDLGVGGWHITTPSTDFSTRTAEESLPMRLSFYGIYSKELNTKLDLQLDAMYQMQQDYRELLFGAYANFYLNQQRGKNRQFRAGLGYKTNPSVLFAKFGFQINEIFVAASYDFDGSDLAFDHPGAPGRGPEIHFRYIIKHVKPGKFKVCPIF